MQGLFSLAYPDLRTWLLIFFRPNGLQGAFLLQISIRMPLDRPVPDLYSLLRAIITLDLESGSVEPTMS
jgi:hypothetical protein